MGKGEWMKGSVGVICPLPHRNEQITPTDLVQYRFSVPDDFGETVRIQTRSSDECSINISLAHQFLRVLRLNTSAILNSDAFRHSWAEHFGQNRTNKTMRLFCLNRRRSTTRSDRPDRLICYYCLCRILGREIFQA